MKWIHFIATALFCCFLWGANAQEGSPKRLKGPYRQQAFYEKIQGKLNFSSAEQHDMIKAAQRMPTEDMEAKAVNAWQYFGPSPALKAPNPLATTVNQNITGRIRDIAVEVPQTFFGDMGIRVLAATGGVWGIGEYSLGGFTFYSPINLSASLPVKDFGSFSFHPTDPGIILVGSGEPGAVCGSGLWKSVDNGQTWANIPMDPANPYPCLIHKMYHDPITPWVIHAATGNGYMQSTDGGDTWVRTSPNADMTDLAKDPTSWGTWYLAGANGQLYKSTNNGTTWTALSSNLPLNQSIHTAVAVVGNRVVANMVAPNQNTLGIYISNDAGLNFTAMQFQSASFPDLHWGQGYYNNVISISPNNSDYILAGGGGYCRTTNAFNFTGIDAHHPDHHAITWDSNGVMYLGNDGGLYVSYDDGLTFTGVFNVFPITQFYHATVSKANPGYIAGGTQDNGTVYRNSNGWYTLLNGDGIAGAVNHDDPNWMYATSNGTVKIFSNNGGVNWNYENVCPGMDAVVSHERSNSVSWPAINTALMYCNDNVYFRDLLGAWTLLTSSPTPGSIAYMTASNKPSTADRSNIYLSVTHTDPNFRIAVRDRITGNWYYNGNTQGLPTDTDYRVFPHPTMFDVAYATCTGTPASGSAGQKIYKTTDGAINWTNITGNFPNLPITCIVAHPNNPDDLVLGTSGFGYFRSQDGGQNWSRWNNGASAGTIVTSLDVIDSTAINGKVYVISSTYGHSFQKREWSGSDPISNTNIIGQSTDFQLQLYTVTPGQNYQIRLHMPQQSHARISLYNALGQMQEQLFEGPLMSGVYDFQPNMQGLAPGVYTLNVQSQGSTQSIKLLKH